MVTTLTFHGGVDEIGGNKILLEDRGTRVFIDFGMQMGRANRYFAPFLPPRRLSGMGDLMEFGLLPRMRGIYRRDYSRHSGYGDHAEDTAVDGVLLSHAHADHCAYLHYLRHDIPVYCSEASAAVMRCLQETGGGDEYVTYRENFKTYAKRGGGRARARTAKTREEAPRDIRTVRPGKKFRIDSIEVEAAPVDHSLPGTYGFIIHASGGSVGYTADLRYHGRRGGDTRAFVEKCAGSDLDALLCEGTRIDAKRTRTELDVERRVAEHVGKAGRRGGLAVCTYPVRDLDRFLSFYNAAKKSGRRMVVDTKQAYLLKIFSETEALRGEYPPPDDGHLGIFVSRKSWGLLGAGGDPAEGDYPAWERGFLDHPNMVDGAYVRANQGRCLFYCSDYRLTDLIDVRPAPGSAYVRSSTEPFDEEMALDEERVGRWLRHFGLMRSGCMLERVHVSGHGSGEQIRRVVCGAGAGYVVPIHTEKPGAFSGLHGSVRRAKPGSIMKI